MKKLKILIVDDNIEACKNLEELIASQYDMQVIGIANDGQEAIKLVKETEPDIMLLDIIMPELDGLEVLRRLNRLRPKVMVVSSYDKESITKEALSLGADQFITKPIDMDKTLDKLRELINRDHNEIIEKQISNLLVHMDLPVYLRGYKYIKEAIKIIVDSKVIDIDITTIYKMVSKKFETTPNRVKNNIRHIIDHTWDAGVNDICNMLFLSKPSPKELITQLAEKIMSEM